MSFLQSILLGVLQGIAEFLPISSSGHLAFSQSWMGLGEVPVLYDILLHVASLAVVLIYFRKLIWRLILVLFRFLARKSKPEDRADLFMILAVIIATVVTFGGYLGLKLAIGDGVDRMKENLVLVFSLFICTGVLLLVQSFFHPKAKGPLRPHQAFFVGLGQFCGLFPGISRSGATISAAIMSGVDRKRAGEISFLISIPAIVGSMVFKLDELGDAFGAAGADISVPVLIAGMVASFASGMVAFPLLLKMLQKEKLYLFAVYLIPLGVGGLIYQGLFA